MARAAEVREVARYENIFRPRYIRGPGRTPQRARAEATLVVAANQGAILLARTSHDLSPIDRAVEMLVALMA